MLTMVMTMIGEDNDLVKMLALNKHTHKTLRMCVYKQALLLS
jgi:hypothetical protein